MKFKAIVAAAALLASASSFAIVSSDTGNGGLFLAVVNSNLSTPESYDLDLNMVISDIIAHQSDAAYTQSWSVNDANFSTFLAHNGNSAAGMQWAVMGGGNSGVLSVAGTSKLVTTLANGVDLATVSTTTQAKMSFGIANGGTAGISGFIANADPLLGATGSAIVQAGTSYAYFGPNSPTANLNDKLNNNLSFSQINAVGASADVAYLTNPGGRNGTLPINASMFAGKLTFAADAAGVYKLTYAAASTPAVPEPSTYALLIAGLAAVSLVARRRSV